MENLKKQQQQQQKEKTVAAAGRTYLFWEHVLALQCEKNKKAKCTRSETAPG